MKIEKKVRSDGVVVVCNDIVYLTTENNKIADLLVDILNRGVKTCVVLQDEPVTIAEEEEIDGGFRKRNLLDRIKSMRKKEVPDVE